jgi:hypothetical protein
VACKRRHEPGYKFAHQLKLKSLARRVKKSRFRKLTWN